jgi:hypothetical protein
LFLWGALVLGAEAAGIRARWTGMDGWSVFFTGAGILVLAEGGIRLLVPSARGLLAWNLIAGSVLLGLGLGDTIGWPWIGVAGMTALALAILARAGRERP